MPNPLNGWSPQCIIGDHPCCPCDAKMCKCPHHNVNVKKPQSSNNSPYDNRPWGKLNDR